MIEASVVEISRCRSKGFISLIDIRVTFDEARMGVANGITDFDHDSITFNSDNSNSDDVVINKASDGEELDCYDQSKSSFPVELHTEPRSLSARTAFAVENIKHPHTAADYRYLHYPTLRLRTIKRALSLCGHQIVGDGGAVKSSKGIFAAIVSVTVYNPDYETHSSSDSVTLPAGEALPWKGCGDGVTARSSPLTVSVEDPKKFTKLMRKEQEMWDVAEARDRELLNAWDKQCIERDLQLGQAKEREANVADRGASTSFEKGSLSLAQEDSYSADSRQVDESIRAHRAPSSPTATSSSRSFSSLADMRAALASGMPVQYVLGEAFFCTYRFTVNPAVMVPRKSSEVLVEEALRVLSVDILPIMAAPKSCESETAVSNPNLGTGSSLAEQRVQNGLQELKCIEAQPGLVTLKMLDIGTGSGCLLLSCMKKCIELQHEVNPGQASSNRYRSEVDIQGLGIDLSHDALQVALENSTALSLQEKTDFKVLDFGNLSALVPGPILSKLVGSPSRVDVTDLQLAGDATDERQKIVSSGSPILDLPVSSPLGHVPTGHDSPPCAALGPFDIILCNPPYSSKRDTTRLSVACREHEPSLALFSPNGPLASYRVLASSLAAAEEKGDRNTRSMQNAASQDEIEAGCARKCVGLFTENGHLFLEVGHGQHLPVQKIFSKLPFLSFVRSAKDHKGIERCLVYRYCGNSVNSDAT